VKWGTFISKASTDVPFRSRFLWDHCPTLRGWRGCHGFMNLPAWTAIAAARSVCPIMTPSPPATKIDRSPYGKARSLRQPRRAGRGLTSSSRKQSALRTGAGSWRHLRASTVACPTQHGLRPLEPSEHTPLPLKLLSAATSSGRLRRISSWMEDPAKAAPSSGRSWCDCETSPDASGRVLAGDWQSLSGLAHGGRMGQ